ncbi:alcohol dehydrogenase catalytic domain-containing protein [bacterium]|nr:alcohol dehydrogenase catalytic domain-containing protein [bacterium]
MKAVMFYAPENIKCEEVPIPEVGEGEILVKVMSALTCGTDVKTYRRGHPVLIKKFPSGFGHEFSGVVEKTGAGVEKFKVGDRVVAANSAPCGKCFYCDKEQFNLCENLDLLNGAYAQYIIVPKRIVEKNTLLLPENLSFDKAAFTEPLANVVHGVERTGIKAGDTVGILGLGPIGLMFAKLAKLKGAKVYAAARNPVKLQKAIDFAQVDDVIDMTKTDNLVESLKKAASAPLGLDVMIECIGLPQMWETAFDTVRKGGTVHFFGGCGGGTKVSFDTSKMHYGDIKMMSVFHYMPKHFRQSLSLIASGNIDVEQLITGTIGLEDVETALKQHIQGNAIKYLVKPWG